ncbi:hypothetical protein ACJMK2_022862 [Sinanodonta woodiana]|uniref:Tyrosinase copper-binding domain-containing protein n=1 Tax=Sinanodonta woodiana TaxID=1069815 RepID=A0ABD3TLC0_SINWO
MKSKWLWATYVALLGAVLVSGLIEEIPMPPEIQSCLKIFQNNTSVADTVEEGMFFSCLNGFLSRPKEGNPYECELSVYDWQYFYRLNKQSVKYVNGVPVPRSGFRIRKEYRQLSYHARRAFHKAVIELKRRGEYDLFACVHQGDVLPSGHRGPNFLGWHRVYLAMFEEALRRIDRTVSLPYWDYTIDYKMSDPTKSVVWTPAFLGNGHGVVNTGPFANWKTFLGPLERNIGVDGVLISKRNVEAILSKCRTKDVIFPSGQPRFQIEYHHNQLHNWVGGAMSELETAAFDPVFFLHHANVDYIWQRFRDRQRKRYCSVDPTKDYPITDDTYHAPNRRMDRFPTFKNIDGYASYWEKYWYRYEPPATCTVVPDCGSPWLECQGGVCLPKSAEEYHLPGTRADTDKSIAGPGSVSLETKDNNPGTGLITPIQNNFFINGVADMKLWVFVPIKVIYMKPADERFPIYPVYNGQPDLNQDFYNDPKFKTDRHLKDHSNCKRNPSGAGQIVLESNGINYVGRYIEYAITDSRLQIGSSMVYIGVKNPETEITEAIISAHDRCGRMCQPQCLDHGSETSRYQPCSGAIRISSASPKMYGNTLGEAIMDVWDWWGGHPKYFTNKSELVMVCNNGADRL